MATSRLSLRVPRNTTSDAVRDVGLDWLVVLLSSFLVGGVYLDGWAHIHRGQLESFFTPWHGVLYSGFVAVSAVLIWVTLRNRSLGFSGARAIPAGYEQALIGVLVFAAGGVADMIWHILFGIEVDLEALLSPTHLMLAAGGALIVSGPLRAAWRETKDSDRSFTRYLPIVLSMTLLLAILAFMTQYMHPFGTTWAAGARSPERLLGESAAIRVDGFPLSQYFVFFEQLASLAGILVQTAILMGLVLTALRRWDLPAGSLTFVLTVSTAMLTLMRDRFIVTGPLALIAVAAAGGVAAELLRARLRPVPARPGAVRVFSFAVPALLYAFYIVALAATGGTWWSVHLWTGAIVLAGITGLLVSYLVVPAPRATAPAGGE